MKIIAGLVLTLFALTADAAKLTQIPPRQLELCMGVARGNTLAMHAVMCSKCTRGPAVLC